MNNSLLGLSPKQKKEIIKEQLLEHPTKAITMRKGIRIIPNSYNNLMADLELQIWNEKHG